MRLRVYLPTRTAVDEEVDKVGADGMEGRFQLLPRHVDYVTALQPGILQYWVNGEERLLAVNGGVLAKQGEEVLVSTPDAMEGESLEELHQAVGEAFQDLDERERRAYQAVQKMEADFVRRFVELEDYESL